MRSLANRLADICAALDDVAVYIGTVASMQDVLVSLSDRKTRDAVLLALLKIGEAAKAMPEDLRLRNPEVDWRGPAALRDLIAHRYFNVDDERIARVVVERLPGLRRAVEFELSRLPPDHAAGNGDGG